MLALPLLPVMARAQQTGPTEQPAPTARTVVPLWPNGAPGFEQRKDIPEQAASYWVKNVNNPSLIVFLPPKEKATGAAVILCSGGGFRELGFVPEGIAAAEYLNSLGVAAFALKYRLPREPGSVYTMTHPRQNRLWDTLAPPAVAAPLTRRIGACSGSEKARRECSRRAFLSATKQRAAQARAGPDFHPKPLADYGEGLRRRATAKSPDRGAQD